MVSQLYYVHLPKSICLMDGNGLKRLSVQSDKGRKYPSRKSVSFTFFYHIYLTVVETNEYNFTGDPLRGKYIATRQQSHRSPHESSRRIFLLGDGERGRTVN